MIISVLFIILCMLCLFGAILYPKTDAKINILKAAVMGIMAVFCYLALWALIYYLLGIRVGVKSSCVSLVLADILLWGGIIWKKKWQRVFFRISDLICLILLAVFVIGISMHLFTPSLRLSYLNTDPANHFRLAMLIVEEGVFEDVYFSAFIDALFIELCAPLLTAVQYFKAFILADIFMHVLEIWMIYVLFLSISDKKISRIFAPVLAVGYFFGYPAYSYMTGGFVYWSNGVMILIFIVYTLLLIEKYPELLRYSGILLLLGIYANSCCNRLFIPVNFFALFVAGAILMLKAKKEKRISGKVFWSCAAIVAAAALAACVLFFFLWGGSVEKILDYIDNVGGIYRSMYVDLVFFIPGFLFVCYHAFWKKSCSRIIAAMSICMILVAVAMYVLWYNYLMSTYYYYKIYYNLWLFGWLLAAAALDILIEQKQAVVFSSYFGMIAGIALITLTNYDYNMWHHNVDYNGSYAPKNIFSLYRFNMDSLLEDYETYEISPMVMDVCRYAVEEADDGVIPALTSDERIRYWFDAMRAQNSRNYAVTKRELMDTLRLMDQKGISKILVIKDDGYYEQYEEYFKHCKVVYENKQAAILTYPGESWCKIVSGIGNYSKDKLKLYQYVKKNLSDVRVPLMAEKSAVLDYVVYEKRTKQSSADCYSWNFNPKENLDNLNALGIRYVLLLNDDTFYQNNQYYFDSQEVVFENSAGKIVKCVGNTWSTEYK